MARQEHLHPSLPESVLATATAVIGSACRLPGAPDTASFWRLLDGAAEAVGTFPPGRFAEGEEARPGGYLDHVDRFDPEFFGISPAEAVAADPQQRLVLELAWEALEDAGIVPRTLAGRRAGVFVGSIGGDYATLVAQAPATVGRHSLTGLNRGIIANRVSYTLDLRGPSLTVDSAQSSSLVAVHLALESLRSGESEVALVAGVNLNLAPDSTLTVDRFGALSPDHRCFTFDARANGYVRGEGGVLLVLKPLARALADGDDVQAVLLGSAVNSDGATDGLTVPGGRTQTAVIRAAVERAGVEGRDVQYVELHGTGTQVGDPIEAAALGAALGAGREPGRPLLVGSAKTNVGHLEGASGIVGLLKTVLSVRHRRLPASLNFVTPNPAIDFEGLALRVRTESGPWPDESRPLVAGVSSFGVGGTNAHVVVAEAPAAAAGTSAASPAADAGVPAPSAASPAEAGASVAPLLWPVSARSAPALRAQAARLLALVEEQPGPDPVSLGRSLATSRSAFEHRAVVTGTERGELVDGLRALARGGQALNLVQGTAHRSGRTVFVFPGQGSQWEAMARELFATAPAFADKLRACEVALAPHTDWSLLDVLLGRPGAPGLERVDVVQPALFAVMVSIAALWEASGVRPDAVIGHSQGRSPPRTCPARSRWRTRPPSSRCGPGPSPGWPVRARVGRPRAGWPRCRCRRRRSGPPWRPGRDGSASRRSTAPRPRWFRASARRWTNCSPATARRAYGYGSSRSTTPRTRRRSSRCATPCPCCSPGSGRGPPGRPSTPPSPVVCWTPRSSLPRTGTAICGRPSSSAAPSGPPTPTATWPSSRPVRTRC